MPCRSSLFRAYITIILLLALAACTAPTAPAGGEAGAAPAAGEAAAPAEESAAPPAEPPPGGVLVPEGREPVLCDPRAPTMTPLAAFPIEETPGVIVEEGTAYFVDYVNEYRQTFRITVESIDGEAALEYISSVQVCFEALADGIISPPETPNMTALGTLLTVIAEFVNATPGDILQSYLTALAAGTAGTLAEVVAEAGVDPDAVLQEALARIFESIDMAEANGLMLPDHAAEARAGVERTLVDAMFEAGGVERLLGNEESLLEMPEDLRANPRNLAVTAEWLELPPEEAERYVVFFVVDPCHVQYQRTWYSWLRRTYVQTRVSVSAGSDGHGLWRWNGSSSDRIDYVIANAGYKSRWMWDWGSCRWFRTHVYGWSSPTNCYTLDGSWRYTSTYYCN